jgi:hypothetical protein
MLTDFFPLVGLPTVETTDSLSLALVPPFAGKGGTVNLVEARVESASVSVLVRGGAAFPYLNSVNGVRIAYV